MRLMTEWQTLRLQCCEVIFPAHLCVIHLAYLKSYYQLCVVHQIRNSFKYLDSKHQKEFLKDLKRVYQAVNKDTAESIRNDLVMKWREQYPIVIKSWRD